MVVLQESPLVQVDIVSTIVHNGVFVGIQMNIGIMEATVEAVDQVGSFASS